MEEARAGYDADEGDWAAFKKFLQEPANEELPALVADAFSHEIFLYAGAGWGEKLALLQKVYGTATFGPLLQKAFGKADDSRAQARLVLQRFWRSPSSCASRTWSSASRSATRPRPPRS